MIIVLLFSLLFKIYDFYLKADLRRQTLYFGQRDVAHGIEAI